MRLYVWNIEIAAAFWGPLSILEVVVRNSIHDTMRKGRSDDWWSKARLATREAATLKSAFDKLQSSNNPLPSPDDVVGATSFGFWVGLVGAGQARDPIYDYETAIWQPRLHAAFPNRGSRGRKQIYGDLNEIRLFRNRIAHHEPIFDRKHEHMRDLMIDVVALVDADVADYIEQVHRIDEVLARKRDAVGIGNCRM